MSSTDNQSSYYQLTQNKQPSPLLVKAIDSMANGQQALDIGCGAGRDTKYLLGRGFHVTAIDKNPDTKQFIDQLPQENLAYHNVDMQNFELQTYHLINAQWVLPFINNNLFQNIFQNLKTALNPGGIFVGQLFGINDGWAKTNREMTFHRKNEAMELFSGLELLHFRETEHDGQLTDGTPKHWHVFHFIAKKV